MIPTKPGKEGIKFTIIYKPINNTKVMLETITSILFDDKKGFFESDYQ